MSNIFVNEIENEIIEEYRKIDNKWLNVHYKTSLALVIFSHTFEIVIAYFIINTEQLNTTIPVFILKFIVIPSALNFIIVFAEYLTVRSRKISLKYKIYVVSFLFVSICFVLFTVHVAFSALYFIFVFPVILTTVYADYFLTAVTSFLGIAGVITSELFIKWDIDKVSIWQNSIRMFDFIISLVIIFVICVVCMVIIRYEREKNRAGIQKEVERYELRHRLKIDGLTGIYNKNAFQSSLKDMEEDYATTKYIFVMIDVDNFKSLNDTFGHMVGDSCLIEVGRAMREKCLDGIPFRYGGDEFCILFKNHSIDSVRKICRDIQDDIRNSSDRVGLEKELTVSIGIAKNDRNISIAQLVDNADKALYEAKLAKNTIRVFGNPKADLQERSE